MVGPGFAFAIAGSFYAAIAFVGKHLSQDSKDTLTLWLWGEYDSTWSHHFCNMFDAVFGSRHWSWQCFWRSSLASVLAVLLLYSVAVPLSSMRNSLPRMRIGVRTRTQVVRDLPLQLHDCNGLASEAVPSNNTL